MFLCSLSTHRPVKRCECERKWRRAFSFSLIFLFFFCSTSFLGTSFWSVLLLLSSIIYKCWTALNGVSLNARTRICFCFVRIEWVPRIFQKLLELVFSFFVFIYLRENSLESLSKTKEAPWFLGHKIVSPLRMRIKRFSFHFIRILWPPPPPPKKRKEKEGNNITMQSTFIDGITKYESWIQQNKCAAKTIAKW